MILIPRHCVAHLQGRAVSREEIIFFPLSLLPCFSFTRLASAETKPMGFAISFPNLSFEQVLSKEEHAYLEVPSNKSFTFQEIRGELVLVEFLSVYCVNCQRQAPILNRLYFSIENDKSVKGKSEDHRDRRWKQPERG